VYCGLQAVAECADVYSKGVNALAVGPLALDVFYFRALRLKLAAVRADFKKSRWNCSPDQPLVLNYLSYSWVDRACISTRACE
jgi:hypothetical protein